MENIKVHVERFEQETNSLVVYFSGVDGNRTLQTPSFAFQTHNYDSDNIEDIIKILAVNGKSYLEQERLKQSFSNNETLLNQLKDINNKEFEVNVPDPTPLLPDNGEIVDNLEIVI
jgi:hypothetical protein